MAASPGVAKLWRARGYSSSLPQSRVPLWSSGTSSRRFEISMSRYAACQPRRLLAGPEVTGSVPASSSICWLSCDRADRVRSLGSNRSDFESTQFSSKIHRLDQSSPTESTCRYSMLHELNIWALLAWSIDTGGFFWQCLYYQCMPFLRGHTPRLHVQGCLPTADYAEHLARGVYARQNFLHR